MLSVMLVAASLVNKDDEMSVADMFREDFRVGEGMG